MSKAIKSAVASVLAYLVNNPGAVSFIVGEAVVLLAKVGLNVSAAQLGTIVAALLPILLGYFHLSKQAQLRAHQKAAAGLIHAMVGARPVAPTSPAEEQVVVPDSPEGIDGK